jgi:hypothetical protein
MLRVRCGAGVWQWALRGGLIWGARAFRGEPRGLWTHPCTIALCCLHSSVFLCASEFQNRSHLHTGVGGCVAGAVAESCPYRACIFVGGLTRGCTPGWWSWPYRPKSQRRSLKSPRDQVDSASFDVPWRESAIVFLTTDQTDLTDRVTATASIEARAADATWRWPVRGGARFRMVRVCLVLAGYSNSTTCLFS